MELISLEELQKKVYYTDKSEELIAKIEELSDQRTEVMQKDQELYKEIAKYRNMLRSETEAIQTNTFNVLAESIKDVLSMDQWYYCNSDSWNYPRGYYKFTNIRFNKNRKGEISSIKICFHCVQTSSKEVSVKLNSWLWRNYYDVEKSFCKLIVADSVPTYLESIYISCLPVIYSEDSEK